MKEDFHNPCFFSSLETEFSLTDVMHFYIIKENRACPPLLSHHSDEAEATQAFGSEPLAEKSRATGSSAEAGFVFHCRKFLGKRKTGTRSCFCA